jgi:hypothetical protein
MAGIALVESGGLTNNLNNNASTGDFSVGLWQINYFGSLGPSRAASYGEPAALANDPNAQAKAAVSILGGGGGISAWQGDAVGKFAQNGQPLSLGAVTGLLKAAGLSTAGAAGSLPGLEGGQSYADWLAANGGSSVTQTSVNPLDPLGVGSALGSDAAIIADLSSGAFWKRIGVFTLGGAVFIVGLVVFFVSTPEGQKVVSEGSQVAGAAVLA